MLHHNGVMQIDITHLIEAYRRDEDNLRQYSASAAELGVSPEVAGAHTWANATRDAAHKPLLPTPGDCDAAREFFQGFGAWTGEELKAMSDVEINALALQYVSGDVRQMEELCGTMEEYYALSDAGKVSGNISRGDDGRYWFYLGD